MFQKSTPSFSPSAFLILNQHRYTVQNSSIDHANEITETRKPHNQKGRKSRINRYRLLRISFTQLNLHVSYSYMKRENFEQNSFLAVCGGKVLSLYQ